jgi:hypothetical protein
MGKNKQINMGHSINDIWHCLQDAKSLANQLSTKHTGDRAYRAFTSLAGDQTVGFLAYVIWKGRGQGLSSLRLH